MSDKTKSVFFDSSNTERQDYIGDVTRWIKDGAPHSRWGHFEQPLDPDIGVGFNVQIDYETEVQIMSLTGDGTERFSVLISELRQTGRVRHIYPSSDILITNKDSAHVKVFSDIDLLASHPDSDIRHAYGNGKDGSLEVTASNTIINSYAYLNTSQVNTGNTSIPVNNGSIFSAGDEIFIHQTQHSNASVSGRNEFNEIVSISGNTLTLKYPLVNTYYSGIYNAMPSSCTQIVRVPNYQKVVIKSGSITATSWNGTCGGIVLFRAFEYVVNSGAIHVNSNGFRAGARDNSGESWYGRGNTSTSANGSGGRRGWDITRGIAGSSWNRGGGAGGGGGYGASGSNGGGNSYTTGGPAFNDSKILRPMFGSGGGGGRSIYQSPNGWAYAGAGGRGAGFILFFTPILYQTGTIQAVASSGANGQHRYLATGYDAWAGAGGGGAGGGIFICAGYLLDYGQMYTTRGGRGTLPWFDGGYGSHGRIRIQTSRVINYGSYSNYGSYDNTDLGYTDSKPCRVELKLLNAEDAYDRIRKITWYQYISDTNSRFAFSFDDCNTWTVFKDGFWETIDIDDVSIDGMTITEINSLTAYQFMLEGGYNQMQYMHVHISILDGSFMLDSVNINCYDNDVLPYGVEVVGQIYNEHDYSTVE